MAKILSKVFTRVKNIPQPNGAEVQCAPVDIDFPATALLANDLICVAEIPAGVQLQDYAFVLPVVDSNGTPTIAWSFGVLNAGETDLATVYASGLAAGRTNAIVRNPNSDSAQADASVVRKLALKVTTAAATYAGAGKTGQVLLELRG